MSEITLRYMDGTPQWVEVREGDFVEAFVGDDPMSPMIEIAHHGRHLAISFFNERQRRGLRVEHHEREILEVPEDGHRSEIDHPAHYGGKDNIYEAIKVIEAWELGFCLGNVVKYISRAGKKPNVKAVDDLQKAKWYLDREIERRLTADG